MKVLIDTVMEEEFRLRTPEDLTEWESDLVDESEWLEIDEWTFFRWEAVMREMEAVAHEIYKVY